MTDKPERTSDYTGLITDTRIWDEFKLRAGDVILSTPPKCGTTWSQAILVMLLNGKAETDRLVWQDSLWLDCGLGDQAGMKATLDAQASRRCIKSHTPFDGLPYRPDVIYLTVYRHPVDVFFSLEKHVANMKRDVLDFHFSQAQDANFERFLKAPATNHGTDDTTLASILHHYRSFASWAHLPNVHFFHYANLTRDIRGQISRYASKLGLEPSSDLIEKIAEASSFGAMKKTTSLSIEAKEKGAFAEPSKFFDSATSNKWEGRLSDAQFARYQQRFSELADTAEIQWLENGNA